MRDASFKRSLLPVDVDVCMQLSDNVHIFEAKYLGN